MLNQSEKNHYRVTRVEDLRGDVQQELKKEAEALRLRSLVETSSFTINEASETTSSKTALHDACERSDIHGVEELLKAGANMDALDDHGMTPLQLVTNQAIRELFYKEGWKRDENAPFRLIDPPIDEVIAKSEHFDRDSLEAHNNEQLAWLLDNQLHDPNKVGLGGCLGHTAIHDAAMANNAGAIHILCERGVDPNTLNRDGDPPLMWASRMGNAKAIEALIECGADVNLGDRNRNRPIHHATMKTVRLLLDAGADPTLKDRQGFDALAKAKKYGKGDVFAVLRAHCSEVLSRS